MGNNLTNVDMDNLTKNINPKCPVKTGDDVCDFPLSPLPIKGFGIQMKCTQCGYHRPLTPAENYKYFKQGG